MKEDMIFALYKDRIVTCKSFCNKCRNEYKIDDPMRLYIRINQYQVDKYGCQLVYEQVGDREECLEICRRANMREQSNKGYYRLTNRRSKYEDK